MIADILKKAADGFYLECEDALKLLSLPIGSRDYYSLLYTANAYSRQTFQNRGIVFAQIGLDSQGCGINCKF